MYALTENWPYKWAVVVWGRTEVECNGGKPGETQAIVAFIDHYPNASGK